MCIFSFIQLKVNYSNAVISVRKNICCKENVNKCAKQTFDNIFGIPLTASFQQIANFFYY